MYCSNKNIIDNIINKFKWYFWKKKKSNITWPNKKSNLKIIYLEFWKVISNVVELLKKVTSLIL